MADNKKYYYLKLKENFFDREEIKLLECQENGIIYSNLYLKLCLLSLKGEGRLLYRDSIPYDENMISKLVGIPLDNVRVGLVILERNKLIQKVDTGEIFMLDIQSMIGKSSSEAERVATYRKKIAEVKKRELPQIYSHENNKRYGGNYYLVLKRDNYKCVICNKIDIKVHHIDGYDENKPENNSIDKLVTLCNSCHGTIHSNSNQEINIKVLEYIKCTNVQNCTPEIEIEIEKDIEIKKETETHESIPFKEIIDYLNAKTSSAYRHQSEATRRLIKARWNEGYTLDNFKAVIDIKTAQWVKDDKMRTYLRPQTLFGTKFESYLNEKPINNARTDYYERNKDAFHGTIFDSVDDEARKRAREEAEQRGEYVP